MSLYQPDENQPEIVDLDSCSKKKSVLIGAAVTFAMSFVTLLPFLHLIAGALVAVGFFTKSYQITIRRRVGALIGLLAVLLGTTVYFPLSPDVALVLKMRDPEFASAQKEAIIKMLYQEGNVQLAQVWEKYFPEKIEPEQVPFIIGFGYLFAAFIAALFGSAGGAVGAMLFKRGALAR